MIKRTMKKGLAIVLALVMVFAMTATAFADTDTAGNVTISVVQNNFNLTGSYVGNGSAYSVGTDDEGNEIYVTSYSVPISTIEEYIDVEGYDFKSAYLPEGVDDPMDGKASVLDAILVGLYLSDVTDIEAGWDTYYNNGGYIHNICSADVTNTVVVDHTDSEGTVWYKSSGHGWNIAYSATQGGSMIVPTVYASNIELTNGMDIIVDYSAYEMLWHY